MGGFVLADKSASVVDKASAGAGLAASVALGARLGAFLEEVALKPVAGKPGSAASLRALSVGAVVGLALGVAHLKAAGRARELVRFELSLKLEGHVRENFRLPAKDTGACLPLLEAFAAGECAAARAHLGVLHNEQTKLALEGVVERNERLFWPNAAASFVR